MDNKDELFERENPAAADEPDTEEIAAQPEVSSVEEKPAKKGKKIGIAATVGTIALGAVAFVALKIFKKR